jgi:hypothetical protein
MKHRAVLACGEQLYCLVHPGRHRDGPDEVAAERVPVLVRAFIRSVALMKDGTYRAKDRTG